MFGVSLLSATTQELQILLLIFNMEMPKLQQEKRKLGNCASAIEEGEAGALASTEAFKSDNPFIFHVMRRTYHICRWNKAWVGNRL